MSEAPIPAPTDAPAAAAAAAPEPVAPVEAKLPGDGSPLVSETPKEGEKPEGEKKPDGEVKPEGEAKAPEKYELKLPDGVEANAETLGKFEEVAREHNLSQDAAQKFLDMHLEQTKTQAEAFAQAQTAAWDKTIGEWKGLVEKAYPGDALSKMQVDVGRALDEYGSPEVRQAFNLTGSGWNPHIIGFIHKMASALSEGKLAPSGNQPRQAKAPADILYPSS